MWLLSISQMVESSLPDQMSEDLVALFLAAKLDPNSEYQILLEEKLGSRSVSEEQMQNVHKFLSQSIGKLRRE